MAEDLQQERNRLANRVREQLWRYYPQALKISEPARPSSQDYRCTFAAYCPRCAGTATAASSARGFKLRQPRLERTQPGRISIFHGQSKDGLFGRRGSKSGDATGEPGT
jgi:hypothetical protein